MRKRYILQAIGLVLIIFILSQVDVNEVLRNMYSADMNLLALAFLLVVGGFLIKISRWNSFLSKIGARLDAITVSFMTLGAYGIGLLTPAKAGDFLRAFWASNKTKKPIGKTIATVFLDRVFDLGALVFFGFLGVVIAFGSLAKEPFLLAAIIVALLGIGAFIFLSMQEFIAKLLVEKFIAAMVPKKIIQKTKGFISDFYLAIKKCRPRLLFASLLTFIAWVLVLASDYLIARSIGIDVSFGFILIIMPLVFVVELISIGGIGTREAALAFLFSIAGFALEQAIAFSFMLFIFNTIFTLAGLLAFTLRHDAR